MPRATTPINDQTHLLLVQCDEDAYETTLSEFPSYGTVQAEPKDVVAKPKATVIDGGWGWMVVLGCCVTHVLLGGWSKGYGIIYVKFREEFHTSATLTVCVNGVSKALRMMGAPIATGLAKRFSVKSVAFVGGLIFGGGVLLVAIAPSAWLAFFSIAILTGIGGCLVYSPSIVHVGEYFDKKRGIATGISTAGSGLGGMAFPPLVQILYLTYGFRGTFAVLGAILLNFCVAANLYRPIRKMAENVKSSINHGFLDRSFSVESVESSQPRNFTYGALPEVAIEDEFQPESQTKEKKTGIRKYVDFKILKNPQFFLFAVSMGLATSSFSTAQTLIAATAIMNGVDETRAVVLVSLLGVADVVGRFSFGVIFDIACLRSIREHIYYWSVGVLAVAIFLIAWMTTFVGFLAVGFLQGLAIGCISSQRAVVVADIVGIEQLSSAFGLVNSFQGIFLLVTPFLAGLLRDYTTDYTLSFVFCASLALLSFLLLYTSHIGRYCCRRRRERNTNAECS